MHWLQRVAGENPFGSIAAIAFLSFSLRVLTDSAAMNVVALLVLVLGASFIGVTSKRGRKEEVTGGKTR